MQPDVSVIVPTLREAPNIPELVARVHAALAADGITCEIIIVDDDSRDGTVAAVAVLEKTQPVRLIVRTNERGLSGAVIRGCEQAHGRILVVMDADLSHPPETIPELVRIIRQDRGDFALGSRYIAGGRTEQWTALRRLNSRIATMLAWPVVRCSDPMSGFFAIAADRYRSAADLRPYGYKIGLELMVKCGCRRIVEVPITFVNRTRGESKLTLKQRLLYLRHLSALFAFKYFRSRSRGARSA